MLAQALPRENRIAAAHRVEQVADTIFLTALAFMAVICGFITYAITTL